MARYSAGVTTGAGSATLPIISLYSVAATSPVIREIGLTNTSATSVSLRLVTLTTAGTQGTGLVETKHRFDAPTALCTAFTTHTVAPTIGADAGYRATLGAAVGSGVIWTFGAEGLSCDVGTANGIGVIPVTGAQPIDAYLTFDE
jgi:hypothetical protein